MSHRFDCPSWREAERNGERDYERYGYTSLKTPYDGDYHEEGCPEAAEAYRDGQRHAEYRAQEEEQERREQQRAAERRLAEEQYEYEYMMQAQTEAGYREHEQWAEEQIQDNGDCVDLGGEG
mgnify:FL=1